MTESVKEANLSNSDAWEALFEDWPGRSGAASTIGIISTSGGIGKTELSAKEMTAKAVNACGPALMRIIRS
jgi:hypothetical protein